MLSSSTTTQEHTSIDERETREDRKDDMPKNVSGMDGQTALADKWEKSYAVVRGYVNARISIAIVRATHICLRGSRIQYSSSSSMGG
jgi:hypothetical protein